MYKNLHKDLGLPLGTQRAPAQGAFEHPWLAVTEDETIGCKSRDEARRIMRQTKSIKIVFIYVLGGIKIIKINIIIYCFYYLHSLIL